MPVRATEQAPARPCLVDPIGAVLARTATQLGVGCLLEARDGSIISHALTGPADSVVASAILERSSAPLHAAARRRRTTAVLPGGALISVALPGRRRALIVPMVASGTPLGWLWALVPDGPDRDAEALAQAAAEVARACCQLVAPADPDLLAALRGGRSAPPALLHAAAEHLWVAACTSPAPPSTLAGALELALPDTGDMSAWIAVSDDQVYLVLAGREQTDTYHVQQLVEAAIARIGDVSVSAALSEPVSNVLDLPVARAQADLAVTVSRPGRCFGLAQARSHLVLDHLSQALTELPDLGPDPLQPLLSYDAKRRSDFARTLLAWLDCNCDAARAAELLDMPQNTLRYRVTRAQQVLPVDLSIPSARIEIHLRLRTALQAG